MTTNGVIHMLSVSDSVIVLLIFMMIASLSMPLLKKLHFPHSVFLVMAGVITGVISQWLYDHSGVRWITDLAVGLSRFHLSPEAILVIFLPTLIFESSYNINSRELIKDLPSTLILAVPALLVGRLIGTLDRAETLIQPVILLINCAQTAFDSGINAWCGDELSSPY